MVLHARKLMTRRVATLRPQDPLPRAAERFWRTGYSAFPVVDGRNRLVGILSAADVLHALRRTPVHLQPQTVGAAMSTDVMRAPPDSEVAVLASKLRYARVRVMPITDSDGSLAGIVTRGDLLRRRPASPPPSPSSNPTRLTRTGPRARDVMTPTNELVWVFESQPADFAAGTLNSRTFTALPVINGSGILLGLVSEADLDWRGGGRTAGTVGQAMKSDLVTRSPDTYVSELARLLAPEGEQLRVVPIVNGTRKLLGLVCRSDLLHPSTIQYLSRPPAVSVQPT